MDDTQIEIRSVAAWDEGGLAGKRQEVMDVLWSVPRRRNILGGENVLNLDRSVGQVEIVTC